MEPLEKVGWISGIILAIIGAYSTLIGGIPIPYNYAVFIVAIAILGLTAVWSFKTQKPEKPTPIEVEVKYPPPEATQLPTITGEIVNAMVGMFKNPENPSETLTSFVLFVSLANKTKTPAYLRDYELYVNIGSGFERMKAMRGVHDQQTFTFGRKGGQFEIPDFKERLLNRLNRSAQPIEFPIPYNGFLWFGGDLKFYDPKSEIREYRLICIDQFGQRHELKANQKDFKDFGFVADSFGVKSV